MNALVLVVTAPYVPAEEPQNSRDVAHTCQAESNTTGKRWRITNGSGRGTRQSPTPSTSLPRRWTCPWSGRGRRTRDSADRIVRRDATAGDPQGTVLYGYTGSGDSADLTLDAGKRLLSRSLSLPGGVLLTFTYPGGVATPEYDHVTIRGDIVLSTDSTGKQAGNLYTYDPQTLARCKHVGAEVDPQYVDDGDSILDPNGQKWRYLTGWLEPDEVRALVEGGAIVAVHECAGWEWNVQLSGEIMEQVVIGETSHKYARGGSIPRR